jgi:hypothetical protein
MARPFDYFQARIDDAGDDAALRGLLGEIGLWRAQRLMDIPSQRQAAYALSAIYQRLGEAEQAGHEAEQLMALCRTAPEASRDEMSFVRKHVTRLGRGTMARFGEGEDGDRGRPARKKEGKRVSTHRDGESQEPSAWETARGLAGEGRWQAARDALPGRRGARNQLFFVWTSLCEALELDGDEKQAALEAVRDGLRNRFFDEPNASQTLDSELAQLLGRTLPSRRDPLVDAINAHMSANPESADVVAAASLRQHVDSRGDRKTAPWLFSVVARALVTSSGEAVRTAIVDLSSRGAYAVTAYAEPPFMMLVDLLRDIRPRGVRFRALRQNVLRRDEPDNHQL